MNDTVSSMAEALKQAGDIGQKLVDQRERYAAVAQSAIEVIGVMQAHLAYLGAHDKRRLAEDLKARGLNVEQVKSFLGLVARKEG